MAHFDEVTILQTELEEKNIRYVRKGTDFWVYSDKYPDRTLALIYRSSMDTWMAIESRDGNVWHSSNLYIQNILSMVNKFKNGEPY